MKIAKRLLLGGVTLVGLGTSVFADDLTTLKAQIEALRAQVQRLESDPPPAALPEGMSLLSIRQGSAVATQLPRRRADRIEPEGGLTISVLPAAAAAPTTEVTVQGEIRTILLHESFNHDLTPDRLDVTARARLDVTAKTNTSVGDVEVFIRVQGGDIFDDTARNAIIHSAYASWNITSNWALLIGLQDTASAVQSGIDWDFDFGGFAGITDDYVEQMRLTYTNDSFSAAIAVEDANGVDGLDLDGDGAFVSADEFDTTFDRSDLPEIAGYAMYAVTENDEEKMMFMVTGAVGGDDTPGAFGGDTDWFVGAGGRIKLGGRLTFTTAAGFGEGYLRNQFLLSVLPAPDDEYWGASAGIIADLTDVLQAQLGGAYGETDSAIAAVNDTDQWGVTGGLYWKPVDQVKLGWQADFSSLDSADPTTDIETFTARFISWMTF